MMKKILLLAACCAFSLGAVPRPPAHSFSPATQTRLENGAVVVWQQLDGNGLIDAALFLPGGIAAQRPASAGIAAVTAAMVLRTPVDGKRTLAELARSLGASVTYALDPSDTRFTVECRAADLPRLLAALVSAVARPDPGAFAAARDAALTAADDAALNPVAVAYDMVRQARYRGTGFGAASGGSRLTLTRLSAADAAAFAANNYRARGAFLSLVGSLDASSIAAAQRELSRLAAADFNPPVMRAPDAARTSQVIAHRNISAPWVALAYSAPNCYSKDFAAMLVVEALLGRGGDVHALAFVDGSAANDNYVGAYYQYEADPGALIMFLNGNDNNVDQGVAELSQGIDRLRKRPLSADVLDRGKREAIGAYFTSVTSLTDQAWLLGNAARSPRGTDFENDVPLRIAAVTAADVQRVAKTYLVRETTAVVLPKRTGQ